MCLLHLCCVFPSSLHSSYSSWCLVFFVNENPRVCVSSVALQRTSMCWISQNQSFRFNSTHRVEGIRGIRTSKDLFCRSGRVHIPRRRWQREAVKITIWRDGTSETRTRARHAVAHVLASFSLSSSSGKFPASCHCAVLLLSYSLVMVRLLRGQRIGLGKEGRGKPQERLKKQASVGK